MTSNVQERRSAAERASMASSLAEICSGLTDEQLEAVRHGSGPLLIVAGAGTGKTTVVTRRIAYLIASGLAQPSEVLALTFTEKAAAEMQERVDVLLPYGYADIQISTFHSFGDRLLRQNALEIGLSPDFKVLSGPEQVLFLRDNLFRLPLERYRPPGNPTGHLQALVSHFGKAKDEDRAPAEYVRFAEALVEAAGDEPEARDRAESQLELARCYHTYQKLMTEQGYLDFGDQVWLVLELLRQRPALLERLRQRYRFVLVDEFQDTNYAQFALVKMLAGEAPNLTVVGDDDQSIYQFRGAALGNILEFTEVYPQAHQVVLRTNFRSTQTVLDSAYKSIVHNNPERLEVRNGIDKRLVSDRSQKSTESDSEIEYTSFDLVSSEAEAVAERIAELVEKQGHAYSDCAILVRVNREADPYLRALNMKGIPFRFTGNRGLYSRPEIRFVTSFLRSLCDPTDSISHFHLASHELFAFPRLSLVLLSSYANRRNLPLRRVFELHGLALEPSDETLDIDLPSREAIDGFLNCLEQYLERIADETPGRILYRFVTETGWLEQLTRGQQEGEIAIQNLARFFEIIKNFETLYPGAQLPQFVRHLDLLIEAGDSPAVVEADAGTEAVEVLTVHKSKGLEFPAVFLVGLSEGRFPTRERVAALEFPAELMRDPEAGSAERHVQEERRLFYVAVTRAKEWLWLSSSFDAGQGRAQKVSRFVLEALDRPRVDLAVVRTSSLETLNRFAPQPVAEQGWAKMHPDRMLTLSFRKIDDYLTCPQKYKFVQVLRVPILPHHSVVYGNALHSAVSLCLEGKMKGEMPAFEDLEAEFKRAWTGEGFLTLEHEQQRFQAGLTALQSFYDHELEQELVPLHVEKDFAFTVGRNKVIGRWDRVDSLAGEIILSDYKSAAVANQEQADTRARESLQLSLYALAYRQQEGVLPREVRLIFLETGLVGRSTVDSARLNDALSKIRRAAAGIRARDYTPKPRQRVCSTCAYREICPATTS